MPTTATMQPRLWSEPKKEQPPRESLADRYDRQNREAAAIILTDAQRYAGLPVEWAKLWRQRKENPNEKTQSRR